MEAGSRRLKKPFHKRRLLWAVLPVLPLLWGGWRAAVHRMDFPRLIIHQPLPPLTPGLEPADSPPVGAVAISPDGQTIWSGGNLDFVKSGGKFYLSPAILPICAWDGRTGLLRYTLPGHARLVQALACSPDGKLLASSGMGGTLTSTITMWDTKTRQLVWSRPGSARTPVFSPDSKLLSVGGMIWDAGTGRTVRALKRSVHDRFSDPWYDDAGAAFSPDGRTLASISGDVKYLTKSEAQQAARSSRPPIIGQRIQLWDAAAGHVKTTFPYDQTKALTFSPDGRWIACVNSTGDVAAGDDGTIVRVVNAATGAERWQWEKSPDNDWCMVGLAYSPNGKWLAAELVNHDVALFDAATGRLVKRLRAYELPHGYRALVLKSALAFSQNGNTLVGRGDNTIQVWDTSSLP